MNISDVTRKGNYQRRNTVSSYAKRLYEQEKMLSESSKLEMELEKKKAFTGSKAFNMRNVADKRKQKLCEEVYTRVATRTFGFFLAEAYFKALVLDEDFKENKENEIKSYFITSLKEKCDNDVMSFMEACKTKSKRMDELVEDCKKKGAKAAQKLDKKLAEKNGDDVENFDIDDYIKDEDSKEEEEFKSSDVQEISNVVKEKVIKVIKDEEDRTKEQEQFVNDISNAKAVSENAKIYFKGGRENFTLFKSMMIKNYKSTVKQLSENTDIYTEYGSVNEDGEIKVDMDYIMCDSIMEYTNLELYHTLKIDNYDANGVRKLAESFAFL